MRLKSRKKASIELSVNFLVTLIITLTVFSLGLIFAFKLYAKATDFEKGIDERSQEELRNVLAGGERVAVAFNDAVIPMGQHHTFWLGILNVQNADAKFTINAEITGFKDPNGVYKPKLSIPNTVSNCLVIKKPMTDFEIGVHERVERAIDIRVVKGPTCPQPVGDYIIDVTVNSGATQYGTTKKIYVKVP